MKKLSIIYCFLLLVSILGLPKEIFSQNVGIGNPLPAEKLDVNGNINITGTIKANGIDGTPNQVLMKNSSGTLAWGDLSEFKNHVTFTSVGSSTWTVPAAVIRIRVEAWGGGGGPSGNGSAGGGGYATAIFTVTPAGNVSYTVGGGGLGGNPGITGGTSTVSFGSFFINAFGGSGDNSASTFLVATGGSFNGIGHYGCVGEAGSPNKFEGYQLNATTYRESQSGGKGGDGGNSIHTGGKGVYTLRDAVSSAVIYGIGGSHGQMPGGGGGSWGIWGGSVRNGGQGMVIIHY
jgi:hypothetical protein